MAVGRGKEGRREEQREDVMVKKGGKNMHINQLNLINIAR